MDLEWKLILFTMVSGAGAWLFATAAFGDLKARTEKASLIEAVVAIVLLAAGGLISVLHLSHPDRIMEALNRPASGIFIEASLIGILGLLILAYVILSVRKVAPAVVKGLAVVGIIVGVIFSWECGASYMMPARPTWDTIALPLAYMGTAAAAGGALNLLIKAIAKRDAQDVRLAAMLALGTAALGLILSCVYFASTSQALLRAEFNWAIAMIVALIVDAVCAALCMRGISDLTAATAIAGFAAATGVIGAIALRALMWQSGAGILNFFDML